MSALWAFVCWLAVVLGCAEVATSKKYSNQLGMSLQKRAPLKLLQACFCTNKHGRLFACSLHIHEDELSALARHGFCSEMQIENYPFQLRSKSVPN
eukprot:4787924-Amphidinium_carterae.1